MIGVTANPKTEVRTALRARRRAIAAERAGKDDDARLAEHGLAVVDAHGITTGATVTLYESRPVEPPTGALLTGLLERGIRVLLPITLPDLDLDWFDATDPDRAPLGLQAVDQVDLAFIPGLALDPTGTRLGQGGGCYDKALPRMRPEVPVVLLLHPGELAPDPLPREPHDRLVGLVLTADGLERLPGVLGR